jgi:hypothetical protein
MGCWSVKRAMRQFIALSTMAAVLSACQARHGAADASPTPTVLPTAGVAAHGRYFLQCISNEGVIGPRTYLVRDIGRPGVPIPVASDRAMLRKIASYFDPATLRFAYVLTSPHKRGMIVYDGDDEACTGGGTDFQVLNLSCNTGYDPEDSPDNAMALPDCFMTSRPWIPHERGVPMSLPFTKFHTPASAAHTQ